MKVFITESQLQNLIHESCKKCYINLDVSLPKQGRAAARITPKEFEDKMRAIWDRCAQNNKMLRKFSLDNFVFCLCRKSSDCKEMGKVKHDLSKVHYDDENLGACGKVKQSNGITYLQCYGGGDWENPILFYLYFDGSSFRAYIPTYGNTFNRLTMTALGNNDEDDAKFLKKQGLGKDGSITDATRDNISYNENACLKDFTSRVRLKKKLTEDIGDSKKLRNGSCITFSRRNPTNIAKAFLRWIEKNGIEYSFHSARTQSMYIEFSAETIDYEFRFANHTKPSLYGSEDAIVISFDKNDRLISFVQVDLSNDSELSSSKQLIAIVNECEKYNAIMQSEDGDSYKQVTRERFPMIYDFLPKVKTDEKEEFEENKNYQKWKDAWQKEYKAYVASVANDISKTFVSSNGLRLRYGKWKPLEKFSLTSDNDKMIAKDEFGKLLSSKILSFEEFCHANGIEYPIMPKN